MGNVDLPLIAGETGIEAALEVMQGFGRSGLVTTRNDTYVVLTDEDLIDGYRVRGHRMSLRSDRAIGRWWCLPNFRATRP